MNYFLDNNIVYDLENNIPYIVTLYKSTSTHVSHYSNERNVYWDSSRMISLAGPHKLIFAYSE